MDFVENRLANCRAAVAQAGGISKLSRMMGYSSPSYLVQVLGPNPTRAPSEKFVRKMEAALGLSLGALDVPRAGAQTAEEAQPGVDKKIATGPLDPDVLAQVVQLVLRVSTEAHASLSADKLASLITIGYEDAVENAGAAREGKLRQLVQLLSGFLRRANQFVTPLVQHHQVVRSVDQLAAVE